MNKNAELLTENLIFILLNLAFFAILAVFVFIKSDDPSILEEAYAKKIALILDAARPGMNISIDMQKAIDKWDKDYVGKVVSIEGNLVTVKLKQKGEYSYSFFNDVKLTKYFYRPNYDGGVYTFFVEPYNKVEEVSK